MEEGQVAFVVEERDGREVARARPVELGPAERNQVVVESGVRVGERLIVVGQHQVAEGDRVRVVRVRRRAPEDLDDVSPAAPGTDADSVTVDEERGEER